MLPDMKPTAKSKAGKFCLVLDLDETLVHSSFSVSCISYHSIA